MATYEELMTVIQEGNFVETQNQVRALLDQGKSPSEIIQKGIIEALDIVGKKFSEGECFIPEMLVSARASKKGLEIVKPLLVKSGCKPKGKIILGTVKGDLHDIGKNLVAMMIEGGGWEVIDLGVDVGSEKFLKAIDENPDAVISLSALLTTTMENMKKIVTAIKEKHSGSKILIGGAPVTMDYCKKIRADFYSSAPQGAVNYLKQLVS